MIFKNTKLIGNKKRVTDYTAYSYYRDNAKYLNRQNIGNYVEYSKVITNIYLKIVQGLVEYEGGVYCDKYFYLTGISYPNKTIMKTFGKGGAIKSTMNTHTDKKTSTILFINLFTKNKYWSWTMDYAFTRTLRTMFSENLRLNRPNYKFVLDTIIKNKR